MSGKTFRFLTDEEIEYNLSELDKAVSEFPCASERENLLYYKSFDIIKNLHIENRKLKDIMDERRGMHHQLSEGYQAANEMIEQLKDIIAKRRDTYLQLDKDSQAANETLEYFTNIINKHGICIACGKMFHHAIDEPIASCGCKQSEWHDLTPFMELQFKLFHDRKHREELQAALIAWKNAEDYAAQYSNSRDVETEIADAYEYAISLRNKAIEHVRPQEPAGHVTSDNCGNIKKLINPCGNINVDVLSVTTGLCDICALWDSSLCEGVCSVCAIKYGH